LPNATRERNNTLRVSSGGQVRELSARIAYEWSQGLNLSSIYGGSTTLDKSVTWPSLELTQGKVHNLFKNWATDSKLTASYRRRHDLSGVFVTYYEPGAVDSARESLGMFDRSEAYANEFNPLVSWTTTWKKRISTTLSTNYTFGTATSYLSDSGTLRSVAHSSERGVNLSLSYAFSAPQGLRLPFLRKLRFASDLSLTWSLRAAQTRRSQERFTAGIPTDSTNLQKDNSFGTSLAASYRFSRSIEAGLNAGYSQSRGLSPTTTETMDLDFWVLFRF
jgi:hypothetical protein